MVKISWFKARVQDLDAGAIEGAAQVELFETVKIPIFKELFEAIAISACLFIRPEQVEAPQGASDNGMLLPG